MTRSVPPNLEFAIRTMASVAVENEAQFCELDAVVGDGDFGFSLARGFELLLAEWPDLDRTSSAAFLKAVALVVMRRMGGTSGPLWGTGFLRAADAVGDGPLDAAATVRMLRAAAEGIKSRGNSDVGDKTLLDALVPATDALDAAFRAGYPVVVALDAAATAAAAAASATKTMVAKRGRASYAGERSIGSVDAGATAVAVILQQIASTWPTDDHQVDPEIGRSKMKKFVNAPNAFVAEMLEGVALANPSTLRYVPELNLIMRADAPNDRKVSILQGSGSGHEPAHVMLVGPGMLDGACPGDVFAAPPVDFVHESSKLLKSEMGLLYLVNNYTGDRMAFDMGRELAEAEGIRVETIFIDDDVAVTDSTYTVGRRGVAGNFFVAKAVGAAAEAGATLDDLVTIGKRVNAVTRTMGAALTSCTPPAKGAPLFELGAEEIEIGVGIHGEPGRSRSQMTSATKIAADLVDAVVADLPYDRGDSVALMINGLGGTPISELYLLYGCAHKQLKAKGIDVGRSYVGDYCTSLDMAGASVTMVRLDDELFNLLDAPASVAYRIF